MIPLPPIIIIIAKQKQKHRVKKRKKKGGWLVGWLVDWFGLLFPSYIASITHYKHTNHSFVRGGIFNS